MTDFTPDERTPLRNQLAELEAAAEAAGQRSAVAHECLKGERTQVAYPRQSGVMGDGPSETGREVFAELVRYRDDVHFNRPTAIDPGKRREYERDLTARIFAAIQERGLVFSPNGDGWSATLVDPSKLADAEAADAESREARAAVQRFTQENAAALAAESEAATKDDFARAIREDDVESVAGILRLTQDAQRRREAAGAALTTADLP
jgi:hypothetical protein